MPVFSYTAKDLQGHYHKGEVEAADERLAAMILLKKKLIIIALKSKEKIGKKFWERLILKVPFSEIVIFTRQLATMIGAGLVLSEALDSLAQQQSNKTFKVIIEDISTDVKGGLDFASALQKHPEVFPKLYANLIKAGEASGKLDKILLKLADHLEKERDFRSKVRGAMIYPVVVVTMMLIVMLIMVFFVMPKLTTLYQESNIELPLPTKLLLAFSNLLINFWWLFLIVLILALIFFRRWLKSSKGRAIFDNWLLKLPIAGRVINLVILNNFTSTLGLLVASGIPILDGIKIVSEIVGNIAYKNALETSYKGVERGLSLSDQLLSQPVFPKIVGQMVKTGEETGKLDEVLEKIAIYFETEADNALKNIATLIEPIILVVLGIGVALLVLSIILPIYKLTTSIS